VIRYDLHLPWDKPPLNLNDRHGHWAARHAAVKPVRKAAWALARQAKIPRCSKIRVELHYRPATRRDRDEDNLVATMKVLVDGIVGDAQVVPKDTGRHVERLMPVIHEVEDGRPGELWLSVTILDHTPPVESQPKRRRTAAK
jgi:hypothetical protein